MTKTQRESDSVLLARIDERQKSMEQTIDRIEKIVLNVVPLSEHKMLMSFRNDIEKRVRGLENDRIKLVGAFAAITFIWFLIKPIVDDLILGLVK